MTGRADTDRDHDHPLLPPTPIGRRVCLGGEAAVGQLNEAPLRRPVASPADAYGCTSGWATTRRVALGTRNTWT